MIAHILNGLSALLSSEWLTAIGTVGSVIVALYLALYGDWLRQLRFRPRLSFEARVNQPDAEKTKWGGVRRDGSTIDVPVYYFRLRVLNSGNVAARDVQVYLAEVLRVDADKKERVKRFAPMNLVWAHVNKPSIEALWPGMPRFCDLGHITIPSAKREFAEDLPGVPVGDPVLALDLEVKPNTMGHLLEAGTYELRLVLAAANHSPKTETLEIIFAGKWSEDESAMFSAGFKMRKLP